MENLIKPKIKEMIVFHHLLLYMALQNFTILYFLRYDDLHNRLIVLHKIGVQLVYNSLHFDDKYVTIRYILGIDNSQNAAFWDEIVTNSYFSLLFWLPTLTILNILKVQTAHLHSKFYKFNVHSGQNRTFRTPIKKRIIAKSDFSYSYKKGANEGFSEVITRVYIDYYNSIYALNTEKYAKPNPKFEKRVPGSIEFFQSIKKALRRFFRSHYARLCRIFRVHKKGKNLYLSVRALVDNNLQK